MQNYQLDFTENVVCFHKRNRKYHHAFHKHNVYELYLFLQGNADLITEKSIFTLKRGDLVIIPAGVWHKANVCEDSPYERVYLNIHPSYVKRMSTNETNLADCFKTPSSSDILIFNLSEKEITSFTSAAQNLIKIINGQEYGNDLKQNIYTTEILLLANTAFRFNNHMDESKNIIPSLLLEISNYVIDNLDGDLSLAKIAEHFYMNGAYLSRYYKKHTGLSLQEYIIEKRLEYAKKCLLKGKSVGESAELSGFGNYYNFIRTFKNRVGVSPGKFAKEFNNYKESTR